MWTIISDEASIGVSSDVHYMEQLFWLMINKIQETCHLSRGFTDSSTGAVLTAEPAGGCSPADPGRGRGVSWGLIKQDPVHPGLRINLPCAVLFSAPVF